MISLRLPAVNRKTIYAYIGMHGTEPDAALKEQVEECLRAVEQAAVPRNVYRVLPLKRMDDGIHLTVTTLVLTGNDILAHLENCGEVILCAVTIGVKVEQLLSKTARTSISDALIMDACASALVEAAADELEQSLRSRAASEGYFLTGRFSPGYGDLPLSLQGDILNVLNAQRSIGLSVSDTSILLPRKSITAVLGLSLQPVTGKPAGCAHCALADKCTYHKEGHTCHES